MFGAGGMTLWGFGSVFTFHNLGRVAMMNAASDFRTLRLEAKRAGKDLTRFDAIGPAVRYGITASILAAGMFKLSKAYAETEQKMANLESLGTANIKDVEDQMAGLFKSKGFMVGLRNAEGAIYDIKSANVKDSDLITGLEYASKMAMATMGNIQQGVDAYTTAYNLYYMRQTKMRQGVLNIDEWSQRTTDAFAATVRLYKTKLPELSKQFNMVAGQAALMGQSIEETLPVLGALLTGGMGGRTGRGWARVLSQVGNTEKMQKVLGISLIGKDKMALPALEMIDKVIERFGTQIDAVEAAKLVKAFDTVGARAMMTAVGMRDQIEQGQILAKKRGISDDMARIRSRTLQMQMGRTKDAFTLLGNTMSKDMLPGTLRFYKGLEGMATWMDEFIGGKFLYDAKGGPVGRTEPGVGKWAWKATKIYMWFATITAFGSALEKLGQWLGMWKGIEKGTRFAKPFQWFNKALWWAIKTPFSRVFDFLSRNFLFITGRAQRLQPLFTTITNFFSAIGNFFKTFGKYLYPLWKAYDLLSLERRKNVFGRKVLGQDWETTLREAPEATGIGAPRYGWRDFGGLFIDPIQGMADIQNKLIPQLRDVTININGVEEGEAKRIADEVLARVKNEIGADTPSAKNSNIPNRRLGMPGRSSGLAWGTMQQ